MNNENSLRYKAWLRQYYRQSWWRISLLLFLSFILVGIELANPWPIKLMADSVFGSVPPPAFLSDFSPQNLLLLVAASFIVLYLFQSIFGFITEYLGTRFGFQLDQKLKRQYFWHVLHLPLRSDKRLETGDYVYRLNEESGSLPQLALNNTVTIVQSVVTITGVLVLLILLDWQMTLLSLIIVPFLFLSVMFFGNKLERQSEAVEKAYSDIYNHSSESIENTDIVQSFNRQSGQVAKLSRLLKERLRLELKSTVLGGEFAFTNSLLSVISITVIVIMGGMNVFEGTLTFGGLLIFVTYAQQLYDPLQNLSAAIGMRKDAHGRLKRVFEVIDDHADIENTDKGDVLTKVRGQLNFRNITFSYGDKTVLDGVNLDIKPGEKVGFIGPSGAGKTTLVSLVPRFGIQSKGFVYIDGKDTSTVNLKSLREQIAIVSQEPKLFSISIGENIGFARPDEKYPLPEVMGAASAANASEFIDKLPEKYDAMVDNSGDSLSGGQKQRIAVARAMFKKAPILILDEPTSAQDTASEKKVLEGINALMKGKTVLMVTHKHSLLSAMDTIYVIEAGKIKNVKEFGGLDAYERYLKIHER